MIKKKGNILGLNKWLAWYIQRGINAFQNIPVDVALIHEISFNQMTLFTTKQNVCKTYNK